MLSAKFWAMILRNIWVMFLSKFRAIWRVNLDENLEELPGYLKKSCDLSHPKRQCSDRGSCVAVQPALTPKVLFRIKSLFWRSSDFSSAYARVEIQWISIDFQSIIPSMGIDFPWMGIHENGMEVNGNRFSIDGNPWEPILNRFWKRL